LREPPAGNKLRLAKAHFQYRGRFQQHPARQILSAGAPVAGRRTQERPDGKEKVYGSIP
jgi:hypothetical protein